MTDEKPWRLADLTFVPLGDGRERATINGVEIVRLNGRLLDQGSERSSVGRHR
jgi:hypothetical protein